MTPDHPPRPPLSHIDPAALKDALRPRAAGHVSGVVGLLAEGYCPGAAVGDLVEIHSERRRITAEVVGLRDGKMLMVGLDDLRGIGLGARIEHRGLAASVSCSPHLLGRVLDARGAVLDRANGPIAGPFEWRPIYAPAPGPFERRLIDEPLPVGIRVVDGLLTLGQGQRIGIMAGAGVGKSTLIGSMARHTAADVIVIGLIGERGREVMEFLERTLPQEARARCVTVVATSERSPLERTRGAFVATSIAEYFAGSGRSVLLLIDSVTRFAMAQRELGLSMGEPPATRGYTPSVFAMLPRLLERAGRFRRGGSITGIYTVLVEGDDLNDPVGDAARSILDGHLVLSRDLAAVGHFPAVDVLASISRVASTVCSPPHVDAARRVRRIIARIAEGQELRQIGAYVAGADPELDRALALRPAMDTFCQQGDAEATAFADTVRAMGQLAEAA
ncbi:MAG: FliI/YscN family ATPase [Myxococcales bacterium FL481]|nr:MAG: FliI/YscN family ATPase [Myxococcales bacterium FL481]